MDESGLIAEARRGDLNAFNRLVLAYQDLVYNLTYRLMGDPDSAEDATQDTFIAAYHHLGSYRGGSFKAWILRIATNTCYDELRRRKRRPVSSLEPLDEQGEEVETPFWLTDPAESPEEALVRSQLNKAIQSCLDNLPLEFRAVVVLVDVQGLDYQEAAQAIQKPVGTVKSRLARARLRLRECLRGAGELLPAEYRLQEEIKP